MTYSNGNLSPQPPHISTQPPSTSPSRSAVSPTSPTPADPVPTTEPSIHDEDDDVAMKEEESDLSDGLSDADASGDDDFEIEFDAPAPASADGRSSSPEERRPLKRKAGGIEDDEDIRANPELYGIRRSGRARATAPMVDSDSQEDDSDSDIAVRPRKRRKPTPPRARTRSSQSASESDSDVYATSRRKSKKKAKSNATSRNATPLHHEVRFSSRKAAKVANYNEEDDEDEFIEDEEDPGYTYVEEDTRPIIDVVLNHRKRDDVNPEKLDPGKQDFEYYIKWVGMAHIHASWERMSELNTRRGYRKVDNYFKKFVLEDIRMQQDEDMPPEEKEKWSLDRERDLEAIDDHVKVERVIDARINEEGSTEYYVKWKGLYYDSSTWEDEELVSKIAQDQIDRYLDRTSRLPTSDRREANVNTRAKFETFRDQPSCIQHGTLRDFQIKGLNFLAYNWCKGNSVILADEMGLGKTIQTISFMSWLKNVRRQEGPFIVIVPLSTLPAWAESLDNWAPDMNYVVYTGNEASRAIIREKELQIDQGKVKVNALLTTYEYILLDDGPLSKVRWQFMAIDEAHRLKNKESQLYQKLQSFVAPSRLLITGTPVQNNLKELSALMEFIMPGIIQIDDEIDLQSEDASRRIAEINDKIQPYMLRRTKNKVENDLPPKTEKIIRVELSDIQLEYYRNILTRNYAALNQGSSGPKQSLLNIMMELKKASNHPFMFNSAEERILGENPTREEVFKGLITSSGKMMLLDRLLSKLQKEGHRVLIFSQMVRMLDILSDYLKARGYQYQRLDGNIPSSARRAAIDHFNAPGSADFCFLLSTRAGGLGINLMTADTVILFDSDWNPQADLQAMARAHRIGQTKPVSIYRLVAKETVEEEVLERARNKLMLEFITIQRGITDQEKKELSDKIKAAEPTSPEEISRILKKRGQKMFEQSGNQKKLEELDIDAVLANAEEHQTDQPEGLAADGGEEFLKSFEYVDVKVDDLEWDDIIPKDQLEQIKKDEEAKKNQEYLEQQIAESQPRKRKQADHDREERAAKKRAREMAAQDVDDDSEPERTVDPFRPLSVRETRNLMRGYMRYGDLDDMPEDVVREARLEGRDRGLLRDHLNEIKAVAQRLQDQEEADIKLREQSGKQITKKDRKAVLFDFNGVKRLNAETILERPGEMRMIREEIAKCADIQKYRVLNAKKGAQYTCDWASKEDGMLCVGIARYGYGAWPQIRDDAELGLKDKFFLEEHRVDRKEERSRGDDTSKGIKSPGAVHLVRRADYLLSVLKDRFSNGTNLAARRAVANHHRNHKRNTLVDETRDVSQSRSPAPSRKAHAHRDKPQAHRHRSSQHDSHRFSNGDHGSSHRDRGDRPNSQHRTKSGERINKSKSSPRPHNKERWAAMITAGMSAIQDSLNRVKNATKDKINSKTDRADVLRKELVTIGSFIVDVLLKQDEVRHEPGFEDAVWDYVTAWWPNPGTPSSKIKEMFNRIRVLQQAKETGNGTPVAGARSTPRANGSAASPS